MKLPNKLFSKNSVKDEIQNGTANVDCDDKSILEEHLSQACQSNYKRFDIAISFLTGYNGMFNVTRKKIKVFSQNQLVINKVLFKLLLHRLRN